jgi:hypothetical protein
MSFAMCAISTQENGSISRHRFLTRHGTLRNDRRKGADKQGVVTVVDI